tara:strand:+ start:4034 stop:4303 length:270 start_codon:yes stop_codon:yes gene_type:complete
MKEESYDQPLNQEEDLTIEEDKAVGELNFNLNNVSKHIDRAETNAGDPLYNLKKAKWYLEREILMLEREAVDWNFDREQLRSRKDGHNF